MKILLLKIKVILLFFRQELRLYKFILTTNHLATELYESLKNIDRIIK